MTTALLVIDLQEAMRADRDKGFPWANPEAGGRIVAAFCAAPIVERAEVLADLTGA